MLTNNIKVQVLGPDEVPVVVPDTGFFTSQSTNHIDTNNYGMAPLIGTLFALLFVFVLSTTIILKKKSSSFSIKRQRRAIFALSMLTILLSGASIIAATTHGNDEGYAVDGNVTNELTISATDINLAIKLEDEKTPGFNHTKGVVIIEEPTEAGYTLSAYTTTSADLVKESTEKDEEKGDKEEDKKDEEKTDSETTTTNSETTTSETNTEEENSLTTIKSIDSTTSTKLTKNTWGIALTEPKDKENSDIFRGLPTSKSNALTIKSTNSATKAKDATEFYIGAYVDSKLEYGTYTGTIVYTAVANVVPEKYYIVKFNANGGIGTMEDQHIRVGTPNTLTKNTFTREGYIFKGWNTEPSGNGVDYRDQDTISATNQGTITLYAQWEFVTPTINCPANSVCYAPNADDIIGSMESLGRLEGVPKAGIQQKTNGTNIPTDITSNSEVILVAPNYKRGGYGFAGWSTDYEANESSIIYGPNETINTGDVSAHGIVLYPVWIASSGNLQGWTGCNNLNKATYDATKNKIVATLASVTALKDTRDNNVYAIARLADGKCWMVENLRLDAENSRGEENIAKAQGYKDATTDGFGKFVGLADSEDSDCTNGISGDSINFGTCPNSLYSIDGSNNTINIGTKEKPGHRFPRYNKNNTNMAENATNSKGTALTDSYNEQSNHERWFGYGNYYSWAAAMANTMANTLEQWQHSDEANTSICPKGWTLPLGNKSDGTDRIGSFSYLDLMMGGNGGQNDARTPYGPKIYNDKIWTSFPNNFVFSGQEGSESSINRALFGIYWSTTAIDYMDASVLKIQADNNWSDANVHSQTIVWNSVRCIAES